MFSVIVVVMNKRQLSFKPAEAACTQGVTSHQEDGTDGEGLKYNRAAN